MASRFDRACVSWAGSWWPGLVTAAGPRVVTASGGTSPANRALVAVSSWRLRRVSGRASGSRSARSCAPPGRPEPLPLGPRRGRPHRRLRRARAALDGHPVVRDGQRLARAPDARLHDRGRDRALGAEPTQPVRRVGTRDLRRALPVGARHPAVAAEPRAATGNVDHRPGRRERARVDCEGHRTRL